MQPLEDRSRLTDEHPLGDLKRERGRVETAVRERLGHVVDDRRALELHRRDVDRHLQGRLAWPPASPALRLPTGLLDDPSPNGDDEAGLLAERDELILGDGPTTGPAPAQERLDPDDLLAGELDDRLVDERQLVPFEGRLKPDRRSSSASPRRRSLVATSQRPAIPAPSAKRGPRGREGGRR